MDYNEVTDYIFNLRRFGEMKLGLERITYLLDKLGNPHNKLRVIHVGGTAGKGSTTAMIASILRYSGYSVGMYTSPHLHGYTERIQINEKQIAEDDVVRLFSLVRPIIDKMMLLGPVMTPTFPEVTTALAFYYFAEQRVDFAVIEVMLGGRLDTTNVVDPIISVITNIGLEHTEVLGDTIEKIAYEKAGIIKAGRPVVTAADEKAVAVFEKVCMEKNCRIFRYGDEFSASPVSAVMSGNEFIFDGISVSDMRCRTNLAGYHQIRNAACAIAACLVMKSQGMLLPDDFYLGLDGVEWPGRLELVQKDPDVVLDCAKDAVAFEQLSMSLHEIYKPKRLILVFGDSSDKKHELMLGKVLPMTDVLILTRHKVMGRATDAELLVNTARDLGYSKDVFIIDDVKDAVRYGIRLAEKDDLVCVTGSVFTVGEARELWHDERVIWGREMNEGKNQTR